MCCCGKNRKPQRRTLAMKSPPRNALTVLPIARGSLVIECLGRNGLLVQGPMTGKYYRFGRRRAKVMVDARDVALLEKIPTLRRIVEVG